MGAQGGSSSVDILGRIGSQYPLLIIKGDKKGSVGVWGQGASRKKAYTMQIQGWASAPKEEWAPSTPC